MITVEKCPGAISWDLDDTAYRRELVTRIGGAIGGKFRKPKSLPENLDDIPILDRTIADTSAHKPFKSPAEKIAFRFHSRRQLFPNFGDKLTEARARGVDNFVNTGRANKRIWVDMTTTDLDRNGIGDMFEGLFFTPEGVRRNISKADALRELSKRYERVKHVDDDPRTILYLAGLFPDINFYNIQYGSTGILFDKSEAKRLPNVFRIASFRDVPVTG